VWFTGSDYVTMTVNLIVHLFHGQQATIVAQIMHPSSEAVVLHLEFPPS